MKKKSFRSIIELTLLVLMISMPASAGVYKYKDANGNWHFTDNPIDIPEDSEKLSGMVDGQSGLIDLVSRWDKQGRPRGNIDAPRKR